MSEERDRGERQSGTGTTAEVKRQKMDIRRYYMNWRLDIKWHGKERQWWGKWRLRKMLNRTCGDGKAEDAGDEDRDLGRSLQPWRLALD